MDIAITGASGLIGTALAKSLAGDGHRVVRVVRKGAGGSDTIAWMPDVGTIDAAAFEGLDAVVHLAGEGIAEHRWSDPQKQRILESRTRSTALLASSLAALQNPPSVLLSGSAIGFYGDRGNEVLTETSPAGVGFLAEVCVAWEAATRPAEDVASASPTSARASCSAGRAVHCPRCCRSFVSASEDVSAVVDRSGAGSRSTIMSPRPVFFSTPRCAAPATSLRRSPSRIRASPGLSPTRCTDPHCSPCRRSDPASCSAVSSRRICCSRAPTCAPSGWVRPASRSHTPISIRHCGSCSRSQTGNRRNNNEPDPQELRPEVDGTGTRNCETELGLAQ